MFFLLLLCSSGLAECLPRGARWTEGNITLRCYQSIKCYLKYNWALCNCWRPCLITVLHLASNPTCQHFFKFYNLFAKLRIIYFPSKYFNAKSVGLLQNYSKSNKIPYILFVFISYTMHCATNCFTHTLWNIWHFDRKSAKYRVVPVVLSLKIY